MVLLIDLDPQAHLSLHFGVEVAEDQASTYDLLVSSTPIDQVTVQARENVTLAPADIDLAGAEVELISVTGREVILREALEGLETDHDAILIDCPPSLGVLTINALSAADEVLIPLQAHFFSLQGLSKLLDTVTLVRQRINPQLKVGGLILCMHEAATRLAGEVVADLNRFLDSARGTALLWGDARLYQTYVRRNIKLAESSSFGQTIFDYAPRSNGAQDYARLAREIFGQTATVPGSCSVSLDTRPQAPPPPADPVENVALLVEEVASPVEQVPPPVEEVAPPVEGVVSPVEEVAPPVDEAPRPRSTSVPADYPEPADAPPAVTRLGSAR